MLQKVERKNIDIDKYDACIKCSLQGTIYAMSWYLDVVSPNWCAVIEDDYTAVMPIPIRKKFSISIATQPLLCQQLGIFSKFELNEIIVKEFLNFLPQFYILSFNNDNVYLFDKGILRSNYILDLSLEYEHIYSNFTKHLRRNIKISNRYEQRIVAITVEEYINFLNLNAKWCNKSLSNILLQLIQRSTQEKACELLAVKDKDEEILAAIFFINWNRRKYYLCPSMSEQGKQYRSMVFLLNQIIYENSETDLILDFEGSELPGVKKFYCEFGSRNKPYIVLSKNEWLYLVAKHIF